MTVPAQGLRRVDWLLDHFVQTTPGVRHTLVTSGDGLRVAASKGVDIALADGLSAAVSGLISLARGAAGLLDGESVTQTVVEMVAGYLFVTAMDQGSVLVVYTEPSCDMGMVGYEMTMLANRVGHALSPAARSPVGIPGAGR